MCENGTAQTPETELDVKRIQKEALDLYSEDLINKSYWARTILLLNDSLYDERLSKQESLALRTGAACAFAFMEAVLSTGDEKAAREAHQVFLSGNKTAEAVYAASSNGYLINKVKLGL